MYSLADRYPTFNVTALTHRFGRSMRHGRGQTADGRRVAGQSDGADLLPLLQMVVPEIVDYNLPVEGGFHNLCIVAVKKSYPGQAKKVMNALWGLGHMMMLTRVLLVVDADVDVHDPRAVVWFALNNVDPSRDLVRCPARSTISITAARSCRRSVHKLGIDATRKGAGRRLRARLAARHPDGRRDTNLVTSVGTSMAYGTCSPATTSGPAKARTRSRAAGRPDAETRCGRPGHASCERRCPRSKAKRVSAGRVGTPLAAATLVLREIRLEHTLFALPFAYAGAIFAARGLPSPSQAVWITLAVLGARTAAMAANRYVDRDIDARNPRTAKRALANGSLAPAVMLWTAIFRHRVARRRGRRAQPLCLQLLPLAALGILLYPFCKRFTWGTHFVLGAVDGLAPLGAYIAIAARFSASALLLFVAVTLWVAGFDIVYALMDSRRRPGAKHPLDSRALRSRQRRASSARDAPRMVALPRGRRLPRERRPRVLRRRRVRSGPRGIRSVPAALGQRRLRPQRARLHEQHDLLGRLPRDDARGIHVALTRGAFLSSGAALGAASLAAPAPAAPAGYGAGDTPLWPAR